MTESVDVHEIDYDEGFLQRQAARRLAAGWPPESAEYREGDIVHLETPKWSGGAWEEEGVVTNINNEGFSVTVDRGLNGGGEIWFFPDGREYRPRYGTRVTGKA